MDTVTVLRALWRRRLFVAIVAIVALLAGVMVKYQLPSLQSRSYEVGISSAHILVDTPSSQVVNVSPRGSDTTAARADQPIEADGLEPLPLPEGAPGRYFISRRVKR